MLWRRTSILISSIVLSIFVVLLIRAGSDNASAMAPVCSWLTIDFVEVTQATQTQPNSIQLVDGRRTGVRVYVIGGPDGCWANVRLQIIPSSSSRKTLYRWSQNGPLPIKSSYDRENEDDSFNFNFYPDGWEGINYTFFPEALAYTSINECHPTILLDTDTISRPFTKVCPPVIAGIRVAMKHFDPPFDQPPARSQVIPGTGDAMMWGVYPFPEYDRGFQHGGGYRLAESPDEVLTIEPETDPTGAVLWDRMTAQLRIMDPQPDFLIGWLKRIPSDENPGTSGRGWPPLDRRSWTRVNIGGLLHAAITSMEVGHNFGYEHHQFGSTIDEVGWEVARKMQPPHRVRSRSAKEYMFNGDVSSWTGPEAYLGIYNNSRLTSCERTQRSFRSFPISPPPHPPSGNWSLKPSYELSSMGRPIDQGTAGKGRLDILDNQGGVLYSTNFDPAFLCEEGENCSTIDGPYDILTPSQTNAHVAKLYIDGILQDTITRTVNAPQVTIIRPTPGETLGSNTVISWQAIDADSDALTTMIQYSHNGIKWIPIASELQGEEFPFNPNSLPSSSNAHIRVTVSDGFNTSAAIVSSLSLTPNQAPGAYILTPQDGEAFKAGANVPLLGIGHDPEDGLALPQQNLTWSSSKDGFLDVGGLLNLGNLTVGTHTLTFGATDSQGITSTSAVTITILSPGQPGSEVSCTNQCPTPTPTPTPLGWVEPTPCSDPQRECPTPEPSPTPSCPSGGGTPG